MSAAVTTVPRFEVARDLQQVERPFNVNATGIGRARTFDILPDGQRFVGVIDEGQVDQRQRIHVVMNWFEELKRLVPTK